MKKEKLKIKNLRICNLQSAICNPKGFTLIEMAIVMVIIGILAGAFAGLVGPIIKRYKYTQSRGIVDDAIESATSYAAGTEDIPDNLGGASDFKSVVTEPTDGFKKDLVYFSDADLDNAGDRKVCRQKTTDITVFTCDDSTCLNPNFNTINNVAFVFISGGANYNIQTDNATVPPGEIACPGLPAQCVTVYEQDTPAGIGALTDNYDDIVKWVTLYELKTKAGCLGSPLKILNNELPSGKDGSAYDTRIYADGGVPFPDYKWCIVDPSAPSGFFAATGIANPADCFATPNCNDPATGLVTPTETVWSAVANPLIIAGTLPNPLPAGPRSFRILVFARDDNDGAVGTDNDNCAQKNYVVTINPS